MAVGVNFFWLVVCCLVWFDCGVGLLGDCVWWIGRDGWWFWVEFGLGVWVYFGWDFWFVVIVTIFVLLMVLRLFDFGDFLC